MSGLFSLDSPKGGATVQTLAPELQALKNQILALEERAARLTAGVSDEALLRRPASGTWSIAECLDHLNITGRRSVALVDKAAAELRAKNLRSGGPFRPRLFVKLFIRATEPPARFKTKTGAAFVPGALEPDAVKREFLALQKEFLRQLEALNGLELSRARVRSPFAGWLSYTLYEWLLVLLAHERRHLWQAEKALERL